jgi:hypothetical protein
LRPDRQVVDVPRRARLQIRVTREKREQAETIQVSIVKSCLPSGCRTPTCGFVAMTAPGRVCWKMYQRLTIVAIGTTKRG